MNGGRRAFTTPVEEGGVRRYFLRRGQPPTEPAVPAPPTREQSLHTHLQPPATDENARDHLLRAILTSEPTQQQQQQPSASTSTRAASQLHRRRAGVQQASPLRPIDNNNSTTTGVRVRRQRPSTRRRVRIGLVVTQEQLGQTTAHGVEPAWIIERAIPYVSY